MHLQPLEDQRPYAKYDNGKDPEIHGGVEIFKKPLLLADRAPISIYNIYQRIDLDDRIPDRRFVVQYRDAPEDRRSPHAYLQYDRNDLHQIAEKDHDRAGRIGQRQHQNKSAAAVINDLNRIDGWVTAVDCGDDQQHQHKKRSEERRVGKECL